MFRLTFHVPDAGVHHPAGWSISRPDPCSPAVGPAFNSAGLVADLDGRNRSPAQPAAPAMGLTERWLAQRNFPLQSVSFASAFLPSRSSDRAALECSLCLADLTQKRGGIGWVHGVPWRRFDIPSAFRGRTVRRMPSDASREPPLGSLTDEVLAAVDLRSMVGGAPSAPRGLADGGRPLD